MGMNVEPIGYSRTYPLGLGVHTQLGLNVPTGMGMNVQTPLALHLLWETYPQAQSKQPRGRA